MSQGQRGGEETGGCASVSDVDLLRRGLQSTTIAVENKDAALVFPAVSGTSQLRDSCKHELCVVRVEQVADLALALAKSCEEKNTVGNTFAPWRLAGHIEVFGHARLDQDGGAERDTDILVGNLSSLGLVASSDS